MARTAVTKTCKINRTTPVAPSHLERYCRDLDGWPCSWMGWEKDLPTVDCGHDVSKGWRLSRGRGEGPMKSFVMELTPKYNLKLHLLSRILPLTVTFVIEIL